MAAESQVKRQRQEQEYSTIDSLSKRPKPLNNILSFLDEEEEEEIELSHDLSAIYTTLQRELSTVTDESDQQKTTDEGVESSVMKHLLEASDDELGIPKTENGDEIVDVGLNENIENVTSLLSFSDHDGLWDIEDQTCNYYTFLEYEYGLFT